MKTVDSEEQRGGRASARGKGLEGIMAKTGCYPGMAGMGAARRRAGGRRRRILGRKGQMVHCNHLMSRICAGSVFFDEMEKEALVRPIRKMSQFSGIKVLTYCVMGNHFHLLVRVPDREK